MLAVEPEMSATDPHKESKSQSSQSSYNASGAEFITVLVVINLVAIASAALSARLKLESRMVSRCMKEQQNIVCTI